MFPPIFLEHSYFWLSRLPGSIETSCAQSLRNNERNVSIFISGKKSNANFSANFDWIIQCKCVSIPIWLTFIGSLIFYLCRNFKIDWTYVDSILILKGIDFKLIAKYKKNFIVVHISTALFSYRFQWKKMNYFNPSESPNMININSQLSSKKEILIQHE